MGWLGRLTEDAYIQCSRLDQPATWLVHRLGPMAVHSEGDTLRARPPMGWFGLTCLEGMTRMDGLFFSSEQGSGVARLCSDGHRANDCLSLKRRKRNGQR